MTSALEIETGGSPKVQGWLELQSTNHASKTPIEQRRPNNSPGSICVRISGPVDSGY